MAPKSSILSHQPSQQEEEREDSSSEDELEEAQSGNENKEENSSDDETEEGLSDDEEEILGTLNKSKSQIPAPKSGMISRRNGLDSDPESEGSPSDYRLQPIRNSSLSSSKRSREEDSEIQDSLRGSKSSRVEDKKSASTPGGGGGGAVGCITRLWSNEDEIAVLNGMIEFKTIKGFFPNGDMERFHSFIKGKLNVDFSKDQLKSKIRRMKKRFLNALKKGDNGLDPVFSKPHEVMAFDISKKIWGGAVDGGRIQNVKKKIQKVEKDMVDDRETVEKEDVVGGGGFWSKYPHLNASFDNMKGAFPSLMVPVAGAGFLEEKLSLIGNVKAKELDDRWKQLILEETELNYKVLKLMKEQVQLALDQ